MKKHTDSPIVESDSPIVADVRRARAEIDRECGHDLHTLVEKLRRMEKTSGLRMGTPRRARTRR
jgi:hypothetical protein